MEKRKTVNVVKSNKSNRGCWLLLIPIVLICMLIPLCIGVVSVGLLIGILNPADVVEAQFVAERGDAESALVTISAGLGDVTLSTDEDFNDLFSADIRYVGEVSFSEGGDTVRSIRLEQLHEDMNFWDIFNFFNVSINNDLTWTLLMNPNILTELTIHGGVGELNLNLAQTRLSGLTLGSGVGDAAISLPAPEESYTVDIEGGVGDTTITLPDNVAVRIVAVTGVGDIHIEHNSLQPTGTDGEWQTDNYGSADQHITIEFDGGVGEFTVR